MHLQQIDYAPALPNQKRRRAIRRVAVGVAAVLIAILAIKSAPRAWRHVQILYWQRQAMTYTASADQVVYDSYASDAAKLRNTNPSLATGADGEVFEFAKPLDRFYQLASPPGRFPLATLFLHKMKNRSGEKRLVVVEAYPEVRLYKHGPVGSVEGLRYEVLKPGGLFSSPHLLTDYDLPQLLDGPIKLCAGQIDPKNLNHFTIQGTMNGMQVTIDGWLGDDDRIELSVPTAR